MNVTPVPDFASLIAGALAGRFAKWLGLKALLLRNFWQARSREALRC
jgi:hypothetical protein